jgi:hypothetical protein
VASSSLSIGAAKVRHVEGILCIACVQPNVCRNKGALLSEYPRRLVSRRHTANKERRCYEDEENCCHGSESPHARRRHKDMNEVHSWLVQPLAYQEEPLKKSRKQEEGV